jgi:hypothetical protein
MIMLRESVMQDLLNQIAAQGLKIGNNWVIIQNGEDLWVQNFQNATGGENATAAANVTNQTEIKNQTQAEVLPAGEN